MRQRYLVADLVCIKPLTNVNDLIKNKVKPLTNDLVCIKPLTNFSVHSFVFADTLTRKNLDVWTAD